MRIEQPFAPSLQPAPARTRRTILPFAAEAPTPAPSGADPTAIMNAFARLREQSTPAPPSRTVAQATPPGSTRRLPSPRLQALRRGEIVNSADRGAALLRQISGGALSPGQATADFDAFLNQPVFSPKAASELRTGFSRSVQKITRPAPGRARCGERCKRVSRD